MFAADREKQIERESQASSEDHHVDARGLEEFIKEQRYRFQLQVAFFTYKERWLTTDERRSPHGLAEQDPWKDFPFCPCMQKWLYEAEAGPYNALHLQKAEYEGSKTNAAEIGLQEGLRRTY